MDDTKRNPVDDPSAGEGMRRRAFFGRALVAAGSVAALIGLAGCPGGEQDDDDDDDDD